MMHARWHAAAVVALLLLALPPAAAPARAFDDQPVRYEIGLGFGGAKAFEKSLFNVPFDTEASPDLFYDFRFRQNLRDRWSWGLHVFGTSEKTDPYAVESFTGTSTVRFDVAVAHIGVHARYRLTGGVFRPYLEAGLGYVSGTVDEATLGRLNLSGVSVSGGPGLQVLLTRSLALELEGVFAAGTAKWQRAPFGNSTSKNYDPSLAAGAGSLVWRWGR